MQFPKIMALIIIIILIPSIEAQRQWQQKGRWRQQLYSNKSFMFSFLGAESGYAKITGKTGSALLTVQIGQKEGNHSKKINFSIWMQSKKYATDEIFYIETFVDISFDVGEGQITFGLQEKRIKRQLMFNVTLKNRKEMQLRTVQGIFTIQLIEIQAIEPFIYLELWFILLLIAVMFQSVVLRVNYFAKKPIFEQLLGNWSIFILAYWMIYCTYLIMNQSYYLRYSAKAICLTFGAGWILGFLFFEFVICLLIMCAIFKDQLSMAQCIFSFLVYIMILVLIIPQSYLKVWHCLAAVVIFELWQLPGIKGRNNLDISNKISQIKCLSALYIFPCAIFPIFSFQLNYPEEDKQMWWCYLIFYIVEVAVFFLKSNGGMSANFKRIIFIVKKWIYKSEYEKIQNKLCPLCFQQVQASQMNMNAAGEFSQIDWIQASCNHYFHKSCLQEYIGVTDGCFFDQVEWSTQLKESLKV